MDEEAEDALVLSSSSSSSPSSSSSLLPSALFPLSPCCRCAVAASLCNYVLRSQTAITLLLLSALTPISLSDIPPERSSNPESGSGSGSSSEFRGSVRRATGRRFRDKEHQHQIIAFSPGSVCKEPHRRSVRQEM